MAGVGESGVDRDLLKRARRILGTSSDTETVNAALDRVVFQAEVLAGLRWLAGSRAVRDPWGGEAVHSAGRESIPALHDPVAARPLPGFKVWVRFDDGVEGVVDLSEVAGKGVFARWTDDPAEFDEMKVDPESGTLLWPGDLDVAPDRLYAEVLATELATRAGRRAAAEALAAMNLPVGTPEQMDKEAEG